MVSCKKKCQAKKKRKEKVGFSSACSIANRSASPHTVLVPFHTTRAKKTSWLDDSTQIPGAYYFFSKCVYINYILNAGSEAFDPQILTDFSVCLGDSAILVQTMGMKYIELTLNFEIY